MSNVHWWDIVEAFRFLGSIITQDLKGEVNFSDSPGRRSQLDRLSHLEIPCFVCSLAQTLLDPGPVGRPLKEQADIF